MNNATLIPKDKSSSLDLKIVGIASLIRQRKKKTCWDYRNGRRNIERKVEMKMNEDGAMNIENGKNEKWKKEIVEMRKGKQQGREVREERWINW